MAFVEGVQQCARVARADGEGGYEGGSSVDRKRVARGCERADDEQAGKPRAAP